MPVPGRLPRVVPENGQPLIIDGKLIPPGVSIIHAILSTKQELTFSQTIIGASAYSVHMDESIWGPNAESFIPERWLGGDKTKEPDKCLLTFSKGARACIGIKWVSSVPPHRPIILLMSMQSLAHAEVFYTLAYFFRRYDIQLKTEEIKVVDCFVWKPLEPGLLIDCKRRVD